PDAGRRAVAPRATHVVDPALPRRPPHRRRSLSRRDGAGMNDMTSGSRWWRLATAGVLIALVMALAACGGDDTATTEQASAASGSSGDAAAGVAEAQKTIDSLFAGESFEQPPAKGPKPEAGKKVTVVVTGLAFAGSALFADAAKKAAALTGWDLTIYDG